MIYTPINKFENDEINALCIWEKYDGKKSMFRALKHMQAKKSWFYPRFFRSNTYQQKSLDLML